MPRCEPHPKQIQATRMNIFTNMLKKAGALFTGIVLSLNLTFKNVFRRLRRVGLVLLIGAGILISTTYAYAQTVPAQWSCASSGSGVWDMWTASCANNLNTDSNGCTVNGSGAPTDLCGLGVSSCPFGEKGAGILFGSCADANPPPCGGPGPSDEWDRDCTPACPDGVLDAIFGEECDGGNFGGATCSSVTGGARPNGSLSCNSCSIDSSACTGGLQCGNGNIDGGETCDGGNFGGATCSSVTGGARPNGSLSCNSCSIDSSACTTSGGCGDGNIDVGENCDGSNFGGMTCSLLTGGTRPNGSLSCLPSCSISTSGCTAPSGPVCGDGVREGTESCDGSDLGGNNCTTVGFTGGSLSCMSDCSFNATGCTGGGAVGFFCYAQPSCVGGVYSCGAVANFNKQTPCNYPDNTDPVYQCQDGFESNPVNTWPCSLPPPPTCSLSASSPISSGQTANIAWSTTNNPTACSASGAWSGSKGASGGGETVGPLNNPPQSVYTFALTCFNAGGSGSCSTDVTVTAVTVACGDSIIQAPETCDNGPLNGPWPAACSNVTCTPNSNPCGNGVVDTAFGETCDGGNFGSPPATCSSATGGTLPGGNLSCTGSCTINTGACTPPVVTCGDGVTQSPPETCDDGPLNGPWPAACSDISCTPNSDPCGNNILDAGEVCDSGNFGGATCSSETGGARPNGSLSCINSCQTISSGACTAPVATCGDGNIQPPETCDGGNFGGATCSSETGGARPNGSLSCNSCSIDSGACTPAIPVTVVLSANPPSGFAPLTVDLTAIVSGSAVTPITYSFDCTNDGIADIVMPSLSTSDTESCIYPVAGSYIAAVSVTDNLGATAQNTAPITVGFPPPSVDITANGLDAITVPDGSTVDLAWTVANAPVTCTALIDWSGPQTGNAVNGPVTQGPLFGPSSFTYRIDCSNAGGPTTDSVTVTVSAPPPPAVPANPTPCSSPAFPGTGCTGVSIYTDLDWDDSIGASSYDVYFGACPAPAFIGNTAASFFNLAPLNYVTQYCWQVVARNAGGNTVGPLWTFQSELPTPPTCTISASQAYVLKGQSVDISWNCSSPGGMTSMTLSASPPPPTLQAIVPPGNGTQTFVPQTTTDYTITACNAGGCGSDVITVGMYAPRIKEVLPKP
jgi:hypothetical protein